MKLNFLFFKLHLISWDCSNGKKFGIDRKGNDVVATFGRHELWVIPRSSSSFFDE